MNRFIALALIASIPLPAAGTSVCSTQVSVQEKRDPSPQPSGTIEMLTPTQGVDFSSYMHHVFLTTRKQWLTHLPQSVKSGERGRNVVQFRILRDGTVPKESCVVTESSKQDELDEASLVGIREAAPYGKLPEDFTGDYIELRMKFFYNVTPGKP